MKHQTQPDFLDQFSKKGLQSPVFWINEYTSYWSRALTPHYSHFPSPPASELQTTDTSFTSLSLWGESLLFFPQESQILTADLSQKIVCPRNSFVCSLIAVVRANLKDLCSLCEEPRKGVEKCLCSELQFWRHRTAPAANHEGRKEISFSGAQQRAVMREKQ